MKPPSRRRFWLKLAAGLLFAVVAYGGLYLGTVEYGRATGWTSYPLLTVTSTRVEPSYRLPLPARVSKAIFAPAHWIDRKCRPAAWGLQ